VLAGFKPSLTVGLLPRWGLDISIDAAILVFYYSLNTGKEVIENI